MMICKLYLISFRFVPCLYVRFVRVYVRIMLFIMLYHIHIYVCINSTNLNK